MEIRGAAWPGRSLAGGVGFPLFGRFLGGGGFSAANSVLNRAGGSGGSGGGLGGRGGCGVRLFSVGPRAGFDEAGVDVLVGDDRRVRLRVVHRDRRLEEVGVVAVGVLGLVVGAAGFVAEE